MKDIAKLFKALGDETRLRIIHALTCEEVSVTELAEILNLGQSRVSSQLAVLRECMPVAERREGRTAYLSIETKDPDIADLMAVVRPRFAESRVYKLDADNLQAVVKRRTSKDGQAPGGLGKRYLPGRTWEGFANALLRIAPPQRVADIGIGDGDMTLLLASFARTLAAIDPSEAVLSRVERKASAAGIDDVTFLAGEIEDLPLEDGSVDLVMVSQVLHLVKSPGRAIAECARVLDVGGRLIVLDLKSHDESWVTEKLVHRHLGFSERQLKRWFSRAGLDGVEATAVARDRRPPHFVTVMATGTISSAGAGSDS